MGHSHFLLDEMGLDEMGWHPTYLWKSYLELRWRAWQCWQLPHLTLASFPGARPASRRLQYGKEANLTPQLYTVYCFKL